MLNKEKFETISIEWETDFWHDREVPVSKITAINYDNLNFCDFKRNKSNLQDII